MGNGSSSFPSLSPSSRLSKKLKINNHFRLPSPLPTFPPGGEFASGSIDLGGLRVCQLSTLKKVWATYEGGYDNLGATFFEPASMPQGYFMLGSYAQPNSHPLFGWVLAAKEENSDNGILAEPLDYNLVWSSESLKIRQDGYGYFWLPVAPDGYKAVGLVVTTTSEKPSLGKIRCVRIDFTEECEHDLWIWGQGRDIIDPNGYNIYGLRPSVRGTQAVGVPVGTFVTQKGSDANSLPSYCLKNNSQSRSNSMPNLAQIRKLVDAYSPWIYNHPDEEFLPSSVKWLFENGALLHQRGDDSNPTRVDPTGSNLPQGGSNDGAYWLDLPEDEKAKDIVKKGDLLTSEAYMHVKPMFGGTFTDIAIWVFYPFNGPARAKVGIINVPLGKIGQHIGDWEHITMRISNFDGMLRNVYMSQHSNGTWIDASQLEYRNGNKPVTYASLHGHAIYPKPGLVMQGNDLIGIRNDTAKSKMVMDTGLRYTIVSAGYLGTDTIVEPPWLNYYRKWGPKISYDLDEELKRIEKQLPGNLKPAFEKFVRSLPDEVLGEDGPTGPKVKRSWDGDEA
uniref:Vacuolar protein sorting-associated protein 62 n=1 Tax=Kalanchoe fedtschenkoi TaxID=63787 RepID=A0A7N0V380_KALFE